MPLRDRSRSNQGFTLLEIGIALMIIIVLAGIAIPATSGILSEERIRGQARELQKYALTARNMAISDNRPYEIVFSERSFLVEPYLTGSNADGAVVSSHQLDSDVVYTIERWGDKEFGKPVEAAWIFQPGGICEPVRVHFQSPRGWLEFTFNPLTARPQDEAYSFK